MRAVRCLIVTLGWLAMLIAAPAFAATGAETHIKAAFVSETLTPAPGRTFTLALAMTPDPGWHGYWKNTGDAGMETLVDWSLPAGASAGPLLYPVPERLLIAGLMNYVYEGPYAHLVTITLPPGLRPGTALPIRAKVDWLACTDKICVPEQASLSLDLVVGDGRIDPAARARFDAWRSALPKPLGSKARFEVKSGMMRIGIPIPDALPLDGPWFYPAKGGVIDHAAEQAISRSGDFLIVEVPAKKADASLDAVAGVLALGPGNGLTVEAAPGAVPAAGDPVASGSGARGTGDLPMILATFAAAMLGGILLNIMPCVFPILSLKALSLARAGESAADARRDALAYAAGVILVCVGLGITLLALRSGGSALGWAFQLQDPRVILILLLLVSAIGFNLAGLFELPMLGLGDRLAGGQGVAGAFWTGALAAFVATPCTGPFMAAALGAALVLPAAAAIAIFVGLGLGIALPFLALGFIPALRRRLPRPGPWMGTVRHILAVPMFVTALGLAWILGRQAGVNAMSAGLGAAMLLVVALWWVGARQRRGADHPWRPALPLLLAAVAVAAVLPREAPALAASGQEGEPFSEARLAEIRSQGEPVFLYFTADWCLTCKVNEKAAIERAEVRDAFARGNVAVMVGDWTRGDPVIGRFLARHGRSGVPLYLFYPAGGGEPRVLPQILTPSMLTALAGPPTP